MDGLRAESRRIKRHLSQVEYRCAHIDCHTVIALQGQGQNAVHGLHPQRRLVGQALLTRKAHKAARAVQLVDDVDAAPVLQMGPLIEGHARFAKRVNAGFMQLVHRHTVRLRVYERGAGETLACGTGACAAVVAGIRLGLLGSVVDVQTRGGVLTIEWSGKPF